MNRRMSGSRIVKMNSYEKFVISGNFLQVNIVHKGDEDLNRAIFSYMLKNCRKCTIVIKALVPVI